MTPININDRTEAVTWLVRGHARGSVIVLDQPLSFWGGFDPETGTVIDRRHPQVDVCLRGAIVVMSAGRGSSSASSVIAESIRMGTAPAAVILSSVDEIIVLGAIVADELYGVTMPVVVADSLMFERLGLGSEVILDGGAR